MKKEVIQGKEIQRFTLTNANKTKVVILSLGGIIQEFSIINQGHRQNLVVNFDSAKEYVENPYQICKQIGRVAGRIKNGCFELNDKLVQVPVNEGTNTLHGGEHGVSSQVFDGYQVADNEVTLSLNLDPTVDGFPGDLTLQINYFLTDEDRLNVTYDLVAKTDTVYDPTIHIYWALDQGLNDTTLNINGDEITETTADKIPTGELQKVNGTAYDFTNDQNLAEAVTKLRNEEGLKGFDTAYKVQDSLKEPVAVVNEHNKCVKIKIFSDRNGLVIFTADPKNAANDEKGLFNSLATEVQTLPDSLHNGKFGNVRLTAGEHKRMQIAYQIEKY